jgi:hypothetical protein
MAMHASQHLSSNERAKPEEYVFKNIITNGLSITAFGTEEASDFKTPNILICLRSK